MEKAQGLNKGYLTLTEWFLWAYVVKKNKECLNHVKICKFSNVVLKKVKPSSRDAIKEESYMKRVVRLLKISCLERLKVS